MKPTTAQTRTEKMNGLQFDNLNAVGQHLAYLQDKTPDGLLAQIRQITAPTKVLSIYKSDNLHIMWILTTAKIIKGVPNGNNSES